MLIPPEIPCMESKKAQPFQEKNDQTKRIFWCGHGIFKNMPQDLRLHGEC
jgi:hypothetical protein